METWIEHLNSPLVLIAFMLFVFAGVIKLLLKNNIIKVNQVNSAQLINKVLNYLFILALAGMVFGFFSQKEVLQVAIDKSENKTLENNKTESKQQTVEKESSSSNTISGSTINNSKVNQAGGDITTTENK